MHRLPFILIFLFIVNDTIAQNQWMYLPNNGFYKGSGINDTNYRIEDIYFTDTSVGYAVTLTDKILKTTDGGYSWTIKNDTFNSGNYTLFRSIEFLDGGKYGVAGALGLSIHTWRTIDSGETWVDITAKIDDTTTYTTTVKNMCGLAHYGETFFGVGSWGSKTGRFYKSIDKGATWQTSYMDTNLIKGMVDVVFLSQDTGFVTGCHDKESVVLKTTDGGVSWTKVFSDTTIGGWIWKLQFLDKQTAYGSIEPLFYQDTVCIIRSLDGGNSWDVIPVGSIQHHNNFGGTQGVGFVSQGKGWVGGYYDGIFETVDSCKTWRHVQFGYDLNRFFVIDSNHVFAGGHMPYKYGSWLPNTVPDMRGYSKPPHNLYPVAPNPAKGNVKIEFDLNKATNVVLDIVNVDGKSLYHITNDFLEKGHYTYYWNSVQAPQGNYLVWLGTNEIPITQKFVLLK